MYPGPRQCGAGLPPGNHTMASSMWPCSSWWWLWSGQRLCQDGTVCGVSLCTLWAHTYLAEKRALTLATPPGSQCWLLTGSPAFGNVVSSHPSPQSATCLSPTAPGGLPPNRTWGHYLTGTGAGDGKGSIWRQLTHVATPLEMLDLEKNNQTQNKKPGCPVQLVINSNVR